MKMQASAQPPSPEDFNGESERAGFSFNTECRCRARTPIIAQGSPPFGGVQLERMGDAGSARNLGFFKQRYSTKSGLIIDSQEISVSTSILFIRVQEK